MILEDINKELKEIYSSLMLKYSEIPIKAEEMAEDRERELLAGRNILTFPYLLQINGNLLEHYKRIMVFGQESNGWGDKEFRTKKDIIDFPKDKLYPSIIGGDNISECIDNLQMCLMALYNYHNLYDFAICDRNPYGPFYRDIKEHSLKCGYTLIRNNIAKIGYLYDHKNKFNELFGEKNGRNYGKYRNNLDLNLEFIEYIIKEIELINPDIIIFLTGPEWNYRNLMMKLLSKFDNSFNEKYLNDNKPNKKSPVNELNPISINGRQVRMLWSYHPNGDSQQRLLPMLKDRYEELIK